MLSVGVLLASIALGCGGRHDSAPQSDGPVLDVAVVMAATTQLPEVIEAGGVVRARTTAAVTSRLLAPVLEVRVSPGDRVRAGQVLVRLDDRDLAAEGRRAQAGRQVAEQAAAAATFERDAARAALGLAAATHTRIETLHARKSATDGELDEAVAALRAAEARVAGAEARVAEAAAGLAAAGAGAEAARVGASWALITAPFDGMVTEKLVEPGNMATPGLPLLRLEDPGAFRLEVRLDESRAGAVRVGQRAAVVFDGPAQFTTSAPDSETTSGTVTEIARAVDAGAHAFLVKIDLPRGIGVPSGAFARARFDGPARAALAIPASAVIRRGQLTSVFVVDDGRARLRLIRIGTRVLPQAATGAGGLVEVASGLDAGEQVIDRPAAALRDGLRVRPATHPRTEAGARGGR